MQDVLNISEDLSANVMNIGPFTEENEWLTFLALACELICVGSLFALSSCLG